MLEASGDFTIRFLIGYGSGANRHCSIYSIYHAVFQITWQLSSLTNSSTISVSYNLFPWPLTIIDMESMHNSWILTRCTRNIDRLPWIASTAGRTVFNTLRPKQNGRHFADDTFKCIFFNEIILISLKISLKHVLKRRINNIPTLVQIMACRRPGDKTLSESMMVSLLTHICVTRPQWVNHQSNTS